MRLPDVPEDVLAAGRELEEATTAEERKARGKVYHRARRRWRRAALIRHEATTLPPAKERRRAQPPAQLGSRSVAPTAARARWPEVVTSFYRTLYSDAAD
eukprot:5292085-Lingulodinium_polyedra.AAC.1